MFDAICLGILVADAVARPVDSWPERGRLVLVPDMQLHTGGCAGNTAVGLARMGFSAGIIGKVGADGFGDFYLRAMQREKVDASGVTADPSCHTSATMVMVHSDGERSFIHYLGGNAELRASDVKMDLVRQGRLLHVGGALLTPALDGEPCAGILKQAKAAGITTAMDTAWDSTGRWMKALAPCLPHVDYFLPSVEEARMIAGRQEPRDVASVLLDAGAGTVALKMGTSGCYVRTRDREIRLPTYKVATIDATGAGDAFAAGFLAGVLLGWDLERTAKLANAAGALCTTAMGTTAGLRSLKETQELAERGETLPMK
jgi:sugar/nucleoside kinase (ribokinase family)